AALSIYRLMNGALNAYAEYGKGGDQNPESFSSHGKLLQSVKDERGPKGPNTSLVLIVLSSSHFLSPFCFLGPFWSLSSKQSTEPADPTERTLGSDPAD